MRQMPYSNSELSTFRRCRRQHALTYGRSLVPVKEPAPWAPTSLGSAVHDLLDLWHSDRPAAQRALAEAEADESRAAKTVWFTTTKYIEWEEDSGANSDRRIVETERAVSRELDGHTIIGKIDRVDETEVGTVILDFKTTGLPPKRKAAELLHTTQGKHYAWITGVRDVEFRIIPRYAGGGSEWDELPVEVMRMHYTQNELAVYESHLRQWVAAASENRAAGALPFVESLPSPAPDCSWICPFAEICASAGEDSATAEFMLSEGFVPGDPLARYSEEDNA